MKTNITITEEIYVIGLFFDLLPAGDMKLGIASPAPEKELTIKYMLQEEIKNTAKRPATKVNLISRFESVTIDMPQW